MFVTKRYSLFPRGGSMRLRVGFPQPLMRGLVCARIGGATVGDKIGAWKTCRGLVLSGNFERSVPRPSHRVNSSEQRKYSPYKSRGRSRRLPSVAHSVFWKKITRRFCTHLPRQPIPPMTPWEATHSPVCLSRVPNASLSVASRRKKLLVAK